MIDLHLHSSWSDGRHSPAEMVHRAAETGLETIAIADHDVVGGTSEALVAGHAVGVEVIPAVELTVRWARRVVHLLGYGIDHLSPMLLSQLVAAERAMAAHVDGLRSDLAAEGHIVRPEDLRKAHSRYPTGTSVVLAMVRDRRLGQLKNPWAFLRHAAAQPVTASIEDGIELIHRAGGLAVLAHPAKVTHGRPPLDAHALKPLVDAGLDGLECWSTAHQPEIRDHFRAVAERLGLLATGGSDSHGRANGVAPGDVQIPRTARDDLEAALKAKAPAVG